MADTVLPVRFLIVDGSTTVAAEDAATVEYTDPRANSWRNVVGPYPSYAYLYVRKEELDKISKTSVTIQLKILHGDTVKTVKKLRVLNAQRLSPGDGGQKQSLWLLTLADARANFYTGVRHAFHYRYNVRVPGKDNTTPQFTYYQDSNRPGGVAVPWTWDQMCAHNWTNGVDEGLDDQVWPGLPFTPHGTPENFVVNEVWEDFNKTLARLMCAMAYDDEAGTYSVVRLGATDATFDGQLSAQSANLQTHDDPVIAKMEAPASVSVRFRKWWKQYGTEKLAEDLSQDNWAAQYDTADLTMKVVQKTAASVGYATTNLIAGVEALILDDMCDDDVNDEAARATERATDFYRNALTTKRDRFYYGFRTFSTGSICKIKVWSSLTSDAGEPRTYIVTGPGVVDPDETLKPPLDHLAPPDYTRFAWPQHHDLLQQVQLTSATPNSNDIFTASLVNVDATVDPPTKSTTQTVMLRFSDTIHANADGHPIVTPVVGQVYLARRTGTYNDAGTRRQLYTAEPTRPSLHIRDVTYANESDATAAISKNPISKLIVNKKTALKIKTPHADTGNTTYSEQLEGNQTWTNLQSPAITVTQVDTVNSDEDIEFEDTTAAAPNDEHKLKIKTRGHTEDHPAGKAFVYGDWRRGLLKDSTVVWVTYAADHTITLAKITAKGTDGSLTWTYGHITGYVDPT